MKYAELGGQYVCPLQSINLTELPPRAAVAVADIKGVYFKANEVAGRVHFTAAGHAGPQQLVLTTADGTSTTIPFTLRPQTTLHDSSDRARRFLDHCLYTCLNFVELTHTRLDQRIYMFFVCWLRDHVHTLKGMKYFRADRLKDGIDLYANTQRADGMVYDNCYPRVATDYWDWRLAEGDFIKPFTDGFGNTVGEMKRIPVEADVEYLFVEGLYFTWKATGDDAWMKSLLPHAQGAIDYSLSDPLRFSTKYGLVKRGYTIDTWDFQSEFDRAVEGDIMRIREGQTDFGIMHGDNTGTIAALQMLADMYTHADDHTQANACTTRRDALIDRLNRVCWNGTFFTHHVRENPKTQADFGVDESKQLSLSNAYSLNRGISLSQQQSICDVYQHLRDDLPEGSPGEWFMIYPPFERGFGGHASKWQYMNGGVSPILAGELARGAFHCGKEPYAADVLNRLLQLIETHGHHVHATFTGNLAHQPKPSFTQLDLRPLANVDTAGVGDPSVPRWTGEGTNDLAAFSGGAIVVDGVPVQLIDPTTNNRCACVGLSHHRPGFLPSVDIPVNQIVGHLYLTHTCANTKPAQVVGTLKAHYADGSTHTEFVMRSKHVHGWWYPLLACKQHPGNVRLAWNSSNPRSTDVGICTWAWKNPHPGKVLTHLTLQTPEDDSMWMLFGLTASDAPYEFATSPISYGIPDNWAAAAVIYALIEGQAGVVDDAPRFDRVPISPRWMFSGDSTARVCVCYPESGGYVAYNYECTNDMIRLTLTGSGTSARVRIPLPENATTASVEIDDQAVAGDIEAVGPTRYACFDAPLRGMVNVSIRL
jgi:hypothetical protein